MRVLIVEDESRLARILTLELAHAGFEVHSVASGQEALEESGRGYDCMLLDVMLPDLSGLEVCRRVRETRNLPIIMVTARGQVPDKVAGLELGADDYVVKPVNTEELAARIRAAVRRRHQTAEISAAPYRAGNVALFLEEHQV